MAKADVVAAAKAAFVSAQDAAAESFGEACYDGGAQDQQAADGSSTSAADQAVIDGLNKQVAALQAQDASDVLTGQQALASANAQISSLQSQLASLQSAKSADDSVIQGFQSSVSQLQAALQALQAIIAPPAPPAAS